MRNQSGKLAKVANDMSFENDFGESPLFLAHISKDQAVIGVMSVIGAFAGCAIAGVPLGLVVLAAGFNDILYAGKDGEDRAAKRISAVVDVESEAIYDDYEDEDYDEEPPSCVQDEPKREKRTPKRESTRKAPTRANASVEVEETPDSSEWQWGEGGKTDIQDAPRRSRRQKSAEFDRESDGSTPILPQVTSVAKKELIERLKDECPALLKMVKSHPIRAVGIQRTGKSTLVKKLVLLRMILIPGHRAIASTPHYEPSNPYPDVFEIAGITSDGKRDYASIRREWKALDQRVFQCQVGNTTTIWDEFGLMDKVLDEEEIKSVLTSCLRETMKFGEYPVFILHGETAAFMPGSKGLVNVLLNGTVRVETIGEAIEGEDGLETIRPTGKFNITWLDGSKDSGQIPDWLTEEYLLELLGNPVVQKPQKQEQTKYSTAWLDDESRKRREEAERVEQKKRATQEKEFEQLRQDRYVGNPEDFTVSSGLKEPLRTLLQKTKEHGDWITVREIQRLNLTALQGKSAKQIHQHLGLMSEMGLGEIDEQDKADSAVRFKSY